MKAKERKLWALVDSTGHVFHHLIFCTREQARSNQDGYTNLRIRRIAVRVIPEKR